MKRRHTLPFGAETTDGGVRFRLWAPDADQVALYLEAGSDADGSALPMLREPEGWHAITTKKARAGTRYRYRIGDALYPDPAARWQPDGLSGPSAVVDPTDYDWADKDWCGTPWHHAVIYELHPGSFSQTGDYEGIAEHLDHLVKLGITLIELMPLSDCPGRWNWGYDGVLPFAPAARYGSPAALKRLVDLCHRRGIGVMLDVVYNHFGPEGNYLGHYATGFFTDKHHTPWGAAINFDDRGSANVRQFFIENALYWLDEFHLDGLRFDAVQAIVDDGPVHFLTELGTRIRDQFPDRVIHLVLENDHNDATLLGHGRGGPGPYDAQWNDDVHHALRVLLTNAHGGYYDDYRDDPIAWLGRALAQGLAFQGEPSPYRDHKPRGAPSAALPPSAFINFIQNHDQVGNHAYGWRLPRLAGPEKIAAVAALLLLTPAIPMLFMGEEWASDSPFPFFCDFTGDLADAVRRGRLSEFGHFPEFKDEAARAHIPDPLAESTFASARLDWTELQESAHQAWLVLYRRLIELRHRHIAPLLATGGAADGAFDRFGPTGLAIRWRLGGQVLRLYANLSDKSLSLPADMQGDILYRTHERGGGDLPPWFVAITLATS